MSLLLDALKRAEQEKLARQAQEAPSEETDAVPAAGQAPARKRSLELERVEASAAPASSPVAAQPGGSAVPAAAKREGARTVFAAKQPAAGIPAAGGSRNKAVIAIVAVALLLLAAGGGYVWYEINGAKTGIARTLGAPSAPRPVTPAPMTPAPLTPAPVAASPVAAPAPVAAAASEPGKAATATAPSSVAGPVPPVSVIKPENLASAPGKSRPQPRAAEQVVMRLLREKSGAKAAPLKLDRTIDPPKVRPDVARGYEALKAGDLAAARASYESAVAADATNLDAHLGLATAAARAGDRAAASRHYRRALNLDPRNPSALAGLAALAEFTRPDGVERQLRADLTQFPQSAALHFTLGNVYASQSRWSEAQAAFFESYRLDPENADTLYNLAVSIDHLGQSKLAADYYRRALAAAGPLGAQFDKGQVSRRLAELKP